MPLSVRKPSQLKEEKQQLETTMRTQKAEYKTLIERQEKQIDNLKCQFSPKMKASRQQRAMYEAELLIIPKKQKSVKAKTENYIIKTKQTIEEHQQNLTARLQDIDKRRATADSTLDQLIADKQKQLALVEKNYRNTKEDATKSYEQKIAEIRADIKKQESSTQTELQNLFHKELEELKGRGADTQMVDECKASIEMTEYELKYIDEHRRLVIIYQRNKEELFDHEEELKAKKQILSAKLLQLTEKYAVRKQKHEAAFQALSKELTEKKQEKSRTDEELAKTERFAHDKDLCPPMLADAQEHQTLRSPGQAVDELTGLIVSRQTLLNKFKQAVNLFKLNFSTKNTFNFNMKQTFDDDYLEFANNLNDFLINNKIEEYRRRTSERYVDILDRISKEMGELTRHESDVDKIIHDINKDFRDRNFAGVIKLIALQSVPSSDKMVQLMKRIKNFNDDNRFAMGELNLFSTSNREEVNNKAVDHLQDFMKSLLDNPQRQYITLTDLFQLQFRIIENDNDTGWTDKLSHVCSEGTDTLVKAIINILLINVFKSKVSKRFGDFRIHCMMDEIGKLHPQNVKGILDFANARNILLINSSPTTYNVSDYRYTYLLSKDGKSQTVVHPLISQKKK